MLPVTCPQLLLSRLGVTLNLSKALTIPLLGRVTCHLMMPEVREYYNLESLWSGQEETETEASNPTFL